MKSAAPHPQEALRLAALRLTGLLDSPPEPAFDDLARLASLICETPMALVSLVDEGRQWFKARVGLEATQTDRTLAFCAHAIHDAARTFVVPDTSQDERFRDNPLVTGPPDLRFYAGVPLTSREGLPLGTLCVLDRQPRTLRPEQLEALELLARQATLLIHARQAEALGAHQAEGWEFLENCSDLVQSVDPAGRYLYVNRAWRETLGYTAAEAAQLTVPDVIAPESLHHCMQVMARLMAGEQVPAVETNFLRKDGRRVPVHGLVNVRMVAGRPVATRGVFRDLSRLRLLESTIHDTQERLGLAAQLEEKVLLLEITHQICKSLLLQQDHVSGSQVLEHLERALDVDTSKLLLRLPDSDRYQLVARGPRDLAQHGDRGLAADAQLSTDDLGLRECLETGLCRMQPETGVPHVFANLGVRTLLALPLTVEGEVEGILVVGSTRPRPFARNQVEFVTGLGELLAIVLRQHKLHEELRTTHDELRATRQVVRQQDRLRAMGRMASGIVHDINNALSPITGYVDLILAREELSDRTRNYLRTVLKAGDSLTRTVARLREFYRSRDEQQLELLDLGQVIRDAVELTRPRWRDIPQRDGVTIDVELRLEPELPRMSGSRAELQDALTNLIVNAVDAMPRGGLITVRAFRQGGLLTLEVSDTGTGMSDETRRHCLEPFFTTKGAAGTGMGLAMVYGTVERHGGVLEIESQRGQGTTFRISFPVQVVSEPANGSAERGAPGTRSLKVLCVDDEPLLRELLREMLTQDGHRVTTAPGGSEALELCHQAAAAGKPFDLVITDLGMPFVDGQDLARAIKRELPSTRLLMLTGWGGEADRRPLQLEGIDQLLTKPPKLRELRQALEALFPEEASSTARNEE